MNDCLHISTQQSFNGRFPIDHKHKKNIHCNDIPLLSELAHPPKCNRQSILLNTLILIVRVKTTNNTTKSKWQSASYVQSLIFQLTNTMR